MKLTVAALALLVAGASYADMAAAWETPLMNALQSSGDVNVQGPCGNKLPDSKNMVKCSGKGFSGHADVPWTYQAKMDEKDPDHAMESFKVHGKDNDDGPGNTETFSGQITSKPTDNPRPNFSGKIKSFEKYTMGIHAGDTLTRYYTCDSSDGCKWQEGPSPSPSPPTPSPPTPSKVEDLPLYKATQSDLFWGSCQYKTKHGVNHSAKCTGKDDHEGLEITVQYQAKNLDKPEKLQEEVKFHGKAKSDGDPRIPLEVHAGGKIKMKGDSVKGEGKEKVVPNGGGAKQEVTYKCTGSKNSVHCEWSA